MTPTQPTEEQLERTRTLDWKLANAIANLTGFIGRNTERNLITYPLTTPERLKYVGEIMELFRKHWRELTRVYDNPTRRITWMFNSNNLDKIEVFTSVGAFYFTDDSRDPKAQKNQRFW
jgi:hypothetical protein